MYLLFNVKLVKLPLVFRFEQIIINLNIINMKKVITTLILMYALSLYAQTSGSQTVYTSVYMCYIKYQYDANGNRTNRAYSCEWYGGNQSSRPSNKNNESSTIVFPNPSAGVFTVSSNAELQDAIINIKNIQGQTVKQYTYNGISQKYDIHNLPVGQYFIEVLSNQNKEVLKLIKK
jgi:hypothetical protein